MGRSSSSGRLFIHCSFLLRIENKAGPPGGGLEVFLEILEACYIKTLRTSKVSGVEWKDTGIIQEIQPLENLLRA
jgi:hypothetical protein